MTGACWKFFRRRWKHRKTRECTKLGAHVSDEEEEEGRACRICLQASSSLSDDPFLAPCRCRGSQRWVHRSCLERWQNTVLHEPNSSRAVRCGVCGTLFSCGLLDIHQNSPAGPRRWCKLASFETFISVGLLLATLASTASLVDAPEIGDLKSGSLLLATDQIGTGNFQKSVILLVEHSSWGALGFIINRPLQDSEAQNLLRGHAFTSQEGEKTLPSQQGAKEGGGESSLFERFGGPVHVGNQVAYLYANGSDIPGAERALEGVWWKQQSTRLETGIAGNDVSADGFRDLRARMRLHGYAGWAPRQLEMEIARGAWSVLANVTKDMVFTRDPWTLWEIVTARQDIEDNLTIGRLRSQPKSRCGHTSIVLSRLLEACMSMILKIVEAVKDMISIARMPQFSFPVF